MNTTILTISISFRLHFTGFEYIIYSLWNKEMVGLVIWFGGFLSVYL